MADTTPLVIAQLQELSSAINTLSMQLAVLSDQLEAIDRCTTDTHREVAEISRELWLQRLQQPITQLKP